MWEDVLISLIVVIISLSIWITSLFVYLKYTQFLFLKVLSLKKSKGRSHGKCSDHKTKPKEANKQKTNKNQKDMRKFLEVMDMFIT